MNQSIPRVRIGVPVYNGAKYLAVAIESLLSQTFTDFEVFISDNASSDATAKIARRYAERDARVTFALRRAVRRELFWASSPVPCMAIASARAASFAWCS